MRPIKKGSTDQSCVIRIIDSTTGLPETAVEHNTAGIDLWWRREGEIKTSITEAALAALDSAHSDGGLEHIGDGYYRLDLPDAAVAAGAGENGVVVGGTVTNMVVIGTYIPLVDYDPYDTIRLGLTSLPNAAADAAGGLAISDAGGLDLDAILADTNELQGDWVNGGRLDLILDIIATDTTTDIPALIADVPTVAEFEARTLIAANYVITSDTIAGVTTCTTNTDMVGTDNAALASVCTEGRLAELDAANLPTDVAGVKTDTGNIVTDTNELQTDWVNGGRLDLILDELTTQGDTNEGKLDTIDTVVDAILVDTATTIPGLIAALNDIAATDVWDLASALTTDFGTLLERMFQGIFNKENITDATGAVALRNVGDSADLATWGITDNDTLTVRTEASWA